MNSEKLISAVFAKSTLWNQKDYQHHNRYVLDRLWDEVALEMKSTRYIVRTKWKALRDTFRKELKKWPVRRSDGEGSTEPSPSSTWKYFNSLYFLQNQFTTKSSDENLFDVSDQNELSNKETRDIQVSEMNVGKLDNSSTLTENNSTSKGQKRIQVTPIDEIYKVKRNRYEDDYSISNDLDKPYQHWKSSDEDRSFFESLLPHVRQLSPERKLMLRIKMQEMVYQFAYGNYNHACERRWTTSEDYPMHESQSTNLHKKTKDFSNPTSVASYITDDTEH